jgi:hypothetical protein
MNSDFINLRDQEVLHNIKEYLQSISIESTLLESGASMPYNILIAITPKLASVNMMYVPLPEDHFEDIRLFQLYSLLVSQVKPESRDSLLTLLNELNNRSPVGSFSINDQGEFGFKYIYPVDRYAIPEEKAFLEIFSLYMDCLENFSGLTTQLNAGEINLQDALDRLNAADGG